MKKSILIALILAGGLVRFASGQSFTVTSPDNKLVFVFNNKQYLEYSVKFGDKVVINPSKLGFEFKDEKPMAGNFAVLDHQTKAENETWVPVVKSKHAEILNNYNELTLKLKEKSDPGRTMELRVRAYNDGVAFKTRTSKGR
ncbi:MAG: glycoside hydrolase family 97 N-terminal domain-containing protein [Bacteroidetes bacterium]|nr:glycoside hydrolase family 97 N-terminal domain-containing protein [Bacteroidota bacterium]